MSSLGKAELGMITFFASSHPNDKCGANGLPLTPNSIKDLGNFQQLMSIEHPHLCKYVHISRGKHERLIIVAEHYRESLASTLHTGKFSSEDNLKQLAFEVLSGLEYMNSKGLTHRNLSPENVLFDTKGRVKLAKFGMYHMTDYGADVSFPIGLAKYMAPEVVCAGPVQVDENHGGAVQAPSGPKVDVWSLAVLLLEALLGKQLWSTLSLQQIFHKMLDFVSTDYHPLDVIAKDIPSEALAKLQLLSEEMRDFLRQCLTVSPDKRLCPADLLQHPAFREQRLHQIPYKNGVQLFSVALRCQDLELPKYDKDGRVIDTDDEHLEQRSFDEVFYLWQLAGGDLEAALKKADLVKAKPPVTLLPSFGGNEGEVFGQVRDGCELLDDKVILLSQQQLRQFVSSSEVFGQVTDRCELLDDKVILLSQQQLRQRLQNIDEAAYYPLLEDETISSAGLPSSPSSVDLSETANLPLIIRERDIEYQFHRIMLYERLLKGYPYKRAHIWKEARVDIPPLVRAHIWATLLEVEGDVQGRFDAIDKETATVTDRQIEVDIPRCHQYDELLSSPVAHLKFKRILKAWVVSHPDYVYWQGLDSLSAPFLSLNFNNEALAFACLQAFIPKYLHKFFLKDNSPVIQEYLAVFSHLIAFHDPELSNHLDGIGFIPDLYSIPWFLTMYAHVFPLHKIMHLWDTLLLGNSSFPLCIGVAILHQLRDRLLSYGFNECILLFSDMPEIDIEKVVQDSIRIFCSTPKSATYRQHARPPRRTQEKKDGRPNVSYYSRDYHDLPANELSMEPMTVEELKAEKFPRISAEDLIELSELKGSGFSRSPTKKSQNSKPKIVIVDVRSPDEFKRGTVPNSINIPFQSAFNPEGDLAPSPAVQTLNSYRTPVKVVVGSRGKVASNFANELVRLSYSKVCVLHKGIDVLRQTGLLTVPPADI